MADTGRTVFADDFFASDFWAAGFWSGGDAAPAPGSSGNTPAGRRKPPKHRYQVQIDGQVFHAEDAQHALAILDRAADLAHSAATREAEAIAGSLKRARRIGLATPKVTTTAPIDIAPYRERIRDAYKSAAQEVETRLHMAFLVQRQREDDEAAALLLLI